MKFCYNLTIFKPNYYLKYLVQLQSLKNKFQTIALNFLKSSLIMNLHQIPPNYLNQNPHQISSLASINQKLQFLTYLRMSQPEESLNHHQIVDSETKLFKLNSKGNWDDLGTGFVNITRSYLPIESLHIQFRIASSLKQIDEQENQVSTKISSQEQNFLFQSRQADGNSGSILVFISHQKRFALSFKQSDSQFLQFFSASLQTTQQKVQQQVNGGSPVNSRDRNQNLIQNIKASFWRYQQEQDEPSLVDIFNIFKRLLNQCNEDFVRMMFSKDNVDFIFAVLEYNPLNITKISYRSAINNIHYTNMLQLPNQIQQLAKFNMYLIEFKDISSLIIQPNLQSLISLLMYENSMGIINYIIAHPTLMTSFMSNMTANLENSVKLIEQLISLSNSASMDTRTKLFHNLVENGNLYLILLECLNQPKVWESICVQSEQVTVFQKIIKVFATLSSTSTQVFEDFIINSTSNFSEKGRSIAQLLVFGYLKGNINLKSNILQLISNIFNPDTPRRLEFTKRNNILRCLQRTVLIPICKQLFGNRSLEGEELMMEWISKIYSSFYFILRRVIIDSRIIKKALIWSSKKSIFLVLILKMVKGMLQIKNTYTVKYLINSGTISGLHKGYIKNRGKPNLIGSLFRSIQQDILSGSYESGAQKQLENIFQTDQENNE